MRKILIAGNAKMNLDRESLREMLTSLIAVQPKFPHVDVVLCPPYTLLPWGKELIGEHSIGLGGQNMHWKSAGAYTGEISPQMLLESGCTHVILGHSERRELFGETNQDVARKTGAAISAGLIPIVCIGESLGQREAGETEKVLATQIEECLRGVDVPQPSQIVLAYEPIWAIGTGKTATPDQAQGAHAFIRGRVGDLLGSVQGAAIRILYGGSVKGENAESLLSLKDVDGALVGGASLTPEAFLPILAGSPN